MTPSESGFSFGGLHCRRDFGLTYNAASWPLSPAISRDEYTIAGTSGTLLLGQNEVRKTMRFTGTLVLATEPASQAETQSQLRAIAAWLLDGRKQLIFDYEPERFYWAQVNAETAWSLKNWFGGELNVTFEAQPYAWAVTPTSVQKTTTDRSATLGIGIDTHAETPATIEIENTGTATIEYVAINNDIRFTELGLLAGDTLTITSEQPIGATITGGRNALPNVRNFTPMLLRRGTKVITVVLGYGTGNPSARITVSARGRW